MLFPTPYILRSSLNGYSPEYLLRRNMHTNMNSMRFLSESRSGSQNLKTHITFLPAQALIVYRDNRRKIIPTIITSLHVHANRTHKYNAFLLLDWQELFEMRSQDLA